MPANTEKKIEQRGYSKGYAAGLKRRRKEQIIAQVKNDRLTQLVAAIMAAGMRVGWGKKDAAGKHKKYDLKGLEKMAVNSATRMTNQMDVYQ